MWGLWWVWVAAGLVVGMVEVLVPGFIFLGFAIGALVTGGLILTGLAPSSPGGLLVVFGLLSLAAWAILRRTVGVTRGQVKVWTEDINDHEG